MEAGAEWHSGAYLLETVAIAALILGRFAHSAEEAIVRAVNDTLDNDTVAAVVGSVVGALHGKSVLPGRWIEGLTGRTAEANDGRVFELTDQAVRRFFQPSAPLRLTVLTGTAAVFSDWPQGMR